ncbi:hypothetical protein [Paracoccus halophilus]|nr:hypothetical protein [Paracoccus halophilus]
MSGRPPVALVPAGEFNLPDFAASHADWCDLGFSICEGYLIEAQNLFLEGDPDGFREMAEAQFDTELEDETLAHANALLSGLSFRRLAGEILAVTSGRRAAGLNWWSLANLYRAMETTKGDMRMPRLDPEFEKRLRAAMVLS